MKNRLVQHITVEESTSTQWVNVPKLKIVEFANRVNPDEADHDELQFLGSYCLPSSL